MAYSRPVLAGTGLTQNPTALNPPLAGVQQTTLDADIATTSSLGLVQVGSGLAITPLGVLSATGSDSGLINVKLTTTNYTAVATDYYIGANKKDITITLPLGITGKVYVIKNQISGEITVTGTSSQRIDTATTQVLGTNQSIILVFDGARWNTI